MQNWIRAFWSTLPLISAFFLLQLGIQWLFIWQLDESFSLEKSSIAILQNVLLYCFFWVITASICRIFPNKTKRIQWSFYGVFSLFLLGSIACDQYYLHAHEVLDESILLFDSKEIWIILDLQHRISIGGLLLFVSCLVVPALLIRFIQSLLGQESPVRFKWCLPMILVAFVSFLFVSFPITQTNRFSYFLGKLTQHALHPSENLAELRISPTDFKDIPSAFYNGGKPVNPLFPCLNELDESSHLAPFLTKTSHGKPPNICIIIVESMSSDLFGARGTNTGVLMPFLDSLSKASLYFPNTFSTYQRTHNVLPAVLASVPNTVNGNVFQQIQFPRHYSLFNLLRDDYDNRFHCGVPYDYLNMSGFMQQYPGVKLLKKWDKSRQFHKDSLGSTWGFPDEDLLAQGQASVQQRSSDSKPLFQVFLTISSHDPFVYSNKEAWSNFVRRRALSIPNPKLRKLVKQQAMEFGSFSYVDSCLNDFFQKERLQNTDYKNTIYILTGDHGTELYRRNALSKYSVPLLIFSPLLKRPFQSNAVVSHNDIAPTLLRYLHTIYHVSIPSSVPFVGKDLRFDQRTVMDRQLLFTTNKLRTTDLMDRTLVYLQHQLYRMDDKLDLHASKNKTKTDYFKRILYQFQRLSQYTIIQNHLVDSLSFHQWVGTNLHARTFAQSQHSKLTLKKKMTFVGATACRWKKGILRIELEATVNALRKHSNELLPLLLIQTKKTHYYSKRWTLNQKVRPQIMNYDPNRKCATVRYSLEFDPKTIQQEVKNGEFFIYLLDEKRIQATFNQVHLRFKKVW